MGSEVEGGAGERHGAGDYFRELCGNSVQSDARELHGAGRIHVARSMGRPFGERAGNGGSAGKTLRISRLCRAVFHAVLQQERVRGSGVGSERSAEILGGDVRIREEADEGRALRNRNARGEGSRLGHVGISGDERGVPSQRQLGRCGRK